ncbi:MAG: nuclease [Gemmatimonadaceae bacterium]|nr:nuclease [Gloeobacterales cyanobacterium ES-bin-141]
MSLTLIKGTFRIVGASPDGDSIRFYPDEPQLWNRLPNRVRTNATGGAQLRLDAIDALETHYRPRPGGSIGEQHQPLQYAEAATAELLKFLGFDTVVRGTGQKITAATPTTARGYILTRFADTYGRSVAVAFPGEIDAVDGSEQFLDTRQLRRSANYHMLTAGLAYPTYYSKLYADLRQELSAAVLEARRDLKGLWSEDKTNSGFVVESVETITDEVVILPKLFRRLLDYLELNDEDSSLTGFGAFLEAKRDELTILSEGRFTHLDNVVKVDGQQLQLLYPPEDLVFREK